MKLETRLAGEPGRDPGRLVRRVIIGDQLRLEERREAVIEVLEKGQERLEPMPGFTRRDDRLVEQVERRKPGRGAVPIIVVRGPFNRAEAGSVESLKLLVR